MTDGEVDKIVSDHAALAYLRRILKQDAPELNIADPRQKQTAERKALVDHCTKAGVTVLAVKHRIMTPKVEGAYRVGAGKIRTPDCIVCFHPNGYVSTVLELGAGYGRPIKGKGRRRVPRSHEERFR